MNRKQKRRAKRLEKKKKRTATKQYRGLEKREKKHVSDIAFRISFSATLMAMKDLYPEVDFDMVLLTHRVNSILNEFVAIGNEELEVLMEVCKDEFDINVKGL